MFRAEHYHPVDHAWYPVGPGLFYTLAQAITFLKSYGNDRVRVIRITEEIVLEAGG